jgi:arylformamidase
MEIMQIPSPEWLEAQYNNRKRVPEAAALLERWAAESAAVRARLKPEAALPYGSWGEKLDVFGPVKRKKSRRPAPVFVFIHGGYWRSLTRSDHSFAVETIAKAGACAVVPDYTLCPTVTIPDIARQIAEAVAWTYKNIARYGGDPEYIVVVGHSAGGHLTAMMMGCNWQQLDPTLPPNLVTKGLSISGLYDLAPLQNVPFLKNDLRITQDHIDQASPVHWPRPTQGKLYLAVGGDESEEFLRHQAALAQAWGESRVPIAKVLPGFHHFNIVETLNQPGSVLHGMVLDLLGLSSRSC